MLDSAPIVAQRIYPQQRHARFVVVVCEGYRNSYRTSKLLTTVNSAQFSDTMNQKPPKRSGDVHIVLGNHVIFFSRFVACIGIP